MASTPNIPNVSVIHNFNFQNHSNINKNSKKFTSQINQNGFSFLENFPKK